MRFQGKWQAWRYVMFGAIAKFTQSIDSTKKGRFSILGH